MSEELDIMEDMDAYCPGCNGLLDAQQYLNCECYSCGAVWDPDDIETLFCECGNDTFKETDGKDVCTECNKDITL